MRRREFIVLLGGAAAVSPRAARAQQPTIPVIGWLTIRSSALEQRVSVEVTLAAFGDGLSERGYIVGTNVAIDFQYAAGRHDQLPCVGGRTALACICVSTQQATAQPSGWQWRNPLTTTRRHERPAADAPSSREPIERGEQGGVE